MYRVMVKSHGIVFRLFALIRLFLRNMFGHCEVEILEEDCQLNRINVSHSEKFFTEFFLRIRSLCILNGLTTPQEVGMELTSIYDLYEVPHPT